MKVLVTGAAGFIGFHLCKKLINENVDVVGLDNLNDYYDIKLKKDRLIELGIKSISKKSTNKIYSLQNNFSFYCIDIQDKKSLDYIFEIENFTHVCNLAAQAGVRYSIEHPQKYIDSNVTGFLNILECISKFNGPKLIYASSSSVYGLNNSEIFNEEDYVNSPISVYAATKITNELLAHSYSNMFNIESIGLRFFTVYGPWGRPDMALFKFVKASIEKKPIRVFNYGNMLRDFTYIDDIVSAIFLILKDLRKKKGVNINEDLYKIYNIGRGSPTKLIDFIHCIDEKLKTKTELKFEPIQPGDLVSTYSNTDKLERDYGFKPKINITTGISNFIDWYLDYYKKTS